MKETKFRLWIDGEMEYNVRISGDNISLNDSFKNCKGKLMQYTGLKDINEKEIYEGDIINIGNITGCEVIWEFSLLDSLQNMMNLYGNKNGGVVVIGNIYETTELLEEKQ